eukprot:1727699-Amphidinium_carterae.1
MRWYGGWWHCKACGSWECNCNNKPQCRACQAKRPWNAQHYDHQGRGDGSAKEQEAPPGSAAPPIAAPTNPDDSC